MTDEMMGICLDFIEGTFGMFGRPFHPNVRECYRLGLEPLTDETAWQAVSSLVFGSKWPPSVSEILLVAAKWESPTPSEDDAWIWVYYWCGRSKQPPFPHALVKQATEEFGDLNTIWHQLQYMGTQVTVLRSQYIAAYLRRQTLWYDAVQHEIRLPVAQRSVFLFPVAAGTSFNLLLSPPSKPKLRIA